MTSSHLIVVAHTGQLQFGACSLLLRKLVGSKHCRWSHLFDRDGLSSLRKLNCMPTSSQHSVAKHHARLRCRGLTGHFKLTVAAPDTISSSSAFFLTVRPHECQQLERAVSEEDCCSRDLTTSAFAHTFSSNFLTSVPISTFST